MKELFQMTFTFVIAVVGWIIFRAENLTEAYGFICKMFMNLFDGYNIGFSRGPLLYGIVLLAIEWLQRDKLHALQFSNRKPFNYRLVRWTIYYALLVLISQSIGNEQTFIYFQF